MTIENGGNGPSNNKTNRPVTVTTDQNLLQNLSEDEDEIEANKNKLDLKPNLDFVTNNKAVYKEGLEKFLENEDKENKFDIEFTINFDGNSKTESQISRNGMQALVQSLPLSLRKLSELEEVVYYDRIPVPGFHDNGNFDTSKTEQIKIEEFPRKSDHLSRILVGAYDNKKIYMTPIPESVSTDTEAIRYYQIHTFLHEFFHSIEVAKRDSEVRKKIIFSFNNQKFSFQDRWSEFETLILKGNEPECVSSYANTYIGDLTQDKKNKEPAVFTHALAEQICETFVAYILNIISNDGGWTDFKSHTFGNKNFAEGSEHKNKKRELMDKLYNATLIEPTTNNDTSSQSE